MVQKGLVIMTILRNNIGDLYDGSGHFNMNKIKNIWRNVKLLVRRHKNQESKISMLFKNVKFLKES